MAVKTKTSWRKLKAKDIENEIASAAEKIFEGEKNLYDQNSYFVLVDTLKISLCHRNVKFSDVDKEKVERFKEYIEAISWGNLKVVLVKDDIVIAYNCEIEE